MPKKKKPWRTKQQALAEIEKLHKTHTKLHKTHRKLHEAHENLGLALKIAKENLKMMNFPG
jgi:hypothetical protein